jgi:cob(I)alamin adenosyltransferase
VVKIYTKTGDAGDTSFFGGERVKKSDLRIEVYGTLDELNSVLGVSLSFVGDSALKDSLLHIQHDLFTLGAELAALTFDGNHAMPKVTAQHVLDLEGQIDAIDAVLEEQKAFILPNGTQASVFLHFARTVARRAERLLVRFGESVTLNAEILRYLNRLSDLLYVMARLANKEVVSEQQPIYKYMEGKV